MVEEYELIITFTTLILLFIIFLVICLSNKTNDIENIFEETEKITIEDRCFEKEEKSSHEEEKKKYKKEKRKIPKRIIQTYSYRDVPERMYKATLTFKELNPDYEYIFYDDERARKFLKDNFDNQVVKAFDLLIPGAYKADLFRICELYINGGYYADIFMEILKSLSYFDKYDVDCILVRDCDNKSIYNAFIACIPENKFIKHLIDKTVNNILNKNMGNGPLDITGPTFIARIFRNYMNKEIKLGLDGEIFILEHSKDGYVKFNNDLIIKRKYHNYLKDIKEYKHYSDLYKDGKIFN